MSKDNYKEELVLWQQKATQVNDETKLEDGLLLVEESARFLESGELSLEESLALYEQSVKLAASLQKRLEGALQKIDELLPDGSLRAFGGQDE